KFPEGPLTHVLEQITLGLGLQAQSPTLPVYLQVAETLIVLDQVQMLDSETLHHLLELLGAARVVLCLPHPPMYQSEIALQYVPELDKEASLDLLDYYAARWSMSDLSPDYLAELYAACGGNPLGLCMSLNTRKRFDPGIVSAGVFHRAWESVSEAAQMAWLMLNLHPTLDAEALSALTEADTVVDELEHAWVIEPRFDSDDPLRLLPLARVYAEEKLRAPGLPESTLSLRAEAIQRLAVYLIENQTETDVEHVETAIRLLERAQDADIPP